MKKCNRKYRTMSPFGCYVGRFSGCHIISRLKAQIFIEKCDLAIIICRCATQIVMKIVFGGGAPPFACPKIKFTRGGPRRLIFFQGITDWTPPNTRAQDHACPRLGTKQGPTKGGAAPLRRLYLLPMRPEELLQSDEGLSQVPPPPYPPPPKSKPIWLRWWWGLGLGWIRPTQPWVCVGSGPPSLSRACFFDTRVNFRTHFSHHFPILDQFLVLIFDFFLVHFSPNFSRFCSNFSDF